uniref:type I-C CRISPR-associated protein Cas8c/Csd1 n=1 Tax=Candidatus Electrothrix sp. TaxID=2170559 RepID=UPI00405786F2
MSWLAQLHKTYEQGLTIDQSAVPFEERLMPVSHTLQNAHIHIVIDEQGNFKRAAVLEKTQIVLPATEQSAGRSGTKAPPHPLADKIQYVAKDYSDYGGLKKSFFEEYEQLLARWCESPFSHPKVCAVHAYITKGQVVADLIAHHILHVDEQGKLLEEWPADDLDEKKTEPLIFKVLPKTKGKTEQGNALVCWSVENQGDADSKTWEDQSLQQSWADFDGMTEGAKGLCFILGQEEKLTASHPAKLRHTGDKAKLISANDMSGFTFRGRFTDTSNSIKSGGSQAVGISLEVTQKAHNALRWLIARQGYRNADQVYVSWAVSGKKIPKPLTDTWTMLATAEITKQPEDEQEEEHQVDHTVDIGEGFAHRLNKYIAGYRQELEASEQIVVMGLDSATPGRMGIIYYRELLASEFLDRLHAWHEQFAWPQRHTQEFPDPKGKKKPIRKTIWPKSCPVPRIIAEAAYGDILKSNDTLKKSVLERILPCIVDGRPFPKDRDRKS